MAQHYLKNEIIQEIPESTAETLQKISKFKSLLIYLCLLLTAFTLPSILLF